MSGLADVGGTDSQAAAKGTAPIDSQCLSPQTRALEIHLPTGFENADATRLVRQVKRAGFNTILLSCFRHGYTLFPSPTMRVYGFAKQEPRFRGSDPVPVVLSAARSEGLTVYALVEGLCAGGGKRRHSPILRRRPDWAVQGRNRSNGAAADPPFLCPVNREVWRFLGDLFYEILERYGFRGIYPRHLHYPLKKADERADYCRCDYCRQAVWHSLGVKIDEIPEDPDHPDRYNLTSWRAEQLGGLVRYVRLRVAKACSQPLVLTEVYLCEGAEARSDACGFQNACSWAQDRLLPIAAFRPLPATAEGSEQWIGQVATMAQCALVMPVLSALPEDRLIETLERLAGEPIIGVAVCAPHDLTAPPLNRLASGPWRTRTQVAEDQPLVSVCALLAETARVLPPDDPVRAFLADALRVVQPLGERWPVAQRQTLHENLLGLEERITGEKLDLGDAAPAVLRNFRLARQLLQLVEIEP